MAEEPRVCVTQDDDKPAKGPIHLGDSVTSHFCNEKGEWFMSHYATDGNGNILTSGLIPLGKSKKRGRK